MTPRTVQALKDAGAMVFEAVVLGAICLAMAASMAGCSTFDPGGQSAKALQQTFRFGWDESGNFVSEGDGAQTGGFTMASEGVNGGAIVLKDDGTIDQVQSQFGYYLRYEPKADNAERALANAYANSTVQMQMQLEYLRLLTSIIGARVGVSVGADGSFTPPPQPARSEDPQWRQMLEWWTQQQQKQ